MKTLYRTLFAFLAAGGLLVPPAQAEEKPPASSSADITLSGPFTHQNLAIFLIHGKEVVSGKKFLTLQEALEQKVIIVHETGVVSELAVENVSTVWEVFIQAGDIVKGGRQDRVFSYDLIVPAQSGKVSVAAFCVESGRWQRRGTEEAERFGQSTGQLPGKALRLAVSSARQQGQVWEKVQEQQAKLGKALNKPVVDPRSPTSLPLTLEDKALQEIINAYVAKLEKNIEGKPDVIGFALAVNGKVESAEIYGSPALFRKMWPKLLRAAAVDAFVELQPGKRFESADEIDVRSFLEVAGTPTQTNISNRIQVRTWESAKNVFLETRDREKDVVVHRSYIGR